MPTARADGLVQLAAGDRDVGLDVVDVAAATLSDLDYEELLVLRWYQRTCPDAMTAAAWERMGVLEDRLRRLREAQEDERERRRAPTLTPERVDELEQKLEADAYLSQDELEQWAVAVGLAKPGTRGRVDEDGLWQMDDDCWEEWDRWYERPLAAAWRLMMAPPVGTSPRPRARERRRRHHRAGRSSRSRGDPPRESERHLARSGA